ncbi:MAG TPA: hypothetical protein VF384_12930 [Planctomycetota bacterium]
MHTDSPSPDRPNSRLAGDLAFAAAAAVACYAASCLFVAPGASAVTFGLQWQEMSKAPLELPGQFPHRILAPVLAHCVGMGGDHFVLFTRGLAVLLLGTVCFFGRRRGASALDALLITLAVALTAPIQMYKQHWVGFVDPLCYTLFFCSWLAARRPVLFWGLFLANLFTHELAAFLLPWLWHLRRQVNGSSRADVLGAGLALGIYGAFYLAVKALAPAQKYNADYFFSNPMFPGGTFVIVTLAITHLVVAFGPILAVLAWQQHTRNQDPGRRQLWLVLAGIAAIFCIAWDWARHSNLIVLPLVGASLSFLAAGHRAVYVGLVAAGAALMVWVPPWSSGWPISSMASAVVLGDTKAAVLNPATREPMGGALRDVLTAWVPAVAPLLSGILVLLAAIWVLGFVLARRLPPRSPNRAPGSASALVENVD